MRTRYILNLRETRHPRTVGNKGKSLTFLIDKNFRTPTAFVCTWDGYLRYQKGDGSVLAVVREEVSSP